MDGQDSQYNVEDLYGGGNCDEALETLYSYLDGELTPQRRQQIARHLNECAPCLHAFDFEAELRAVVARCCRDQVPDGLREKISKAISEASGSERRSV